MGKATEGYSKLSPGPGRAASEVAAHQRARLHAAMIELAADRGYEGVCIRDLTAAAKVSSRAFYQQFSGKPACFESAHEMVAQRLADEMLAVPGGEGDSARRLRCTIHAFLTELAEDSRAARIVLFESHAAGPVAQAQARRAIHSFEEAIARSLASSHEDLAPPPLVSEGVALGVERIARARLIAGRESELPHIVEPLSDWALRYCEAAATVLVDPDWPMPDSTLAQVAPAPARRRQREGQGAPAPIGDRALLLSVVSKLATDHDPRDLTAALVCAAAGIPRRRFDAHFDGMGDCLLAALEARIREILADAQHAAALRQSRAGGLYRALSEVCSEIDADPAFAAFVLDAASLTVDWGVLGARQRERLLGAVIARVYGSGPFSSVRRLEVEASVEAAWGLLCRWVAGGRVGRVGQLAGAMTMLLLAADARSERVATAVETEAEACLAKTGHSTNLAKAV